MEQIIFDNVTPAPLVGVTRLSSQIWQTNLVLEQGKCYLVSAASGKGKSTFVGIVYGLRHDYEGTATYGGHHLKKQTLGWWADYRQEKVSIVFQDLRLFPHLTALENILVKANLYSKTPDIQHITAMTDALSVTHLLEKKANTFSYGERQRIAIIRALAQPFQWLLLDEPFSHLDEKNIQAAAQLIEQECSKRKAGWVMASLSDAYGMNCDQVLYL
ncbi:ABC-type lipoprotein export system, ATPase component [Flexibacter flexilis DSM 6793]|uniref:ABC-type lipoprotein export system, ATPase component n=1 Tax=Flexibacter flexilis DSM 6793 TaxID=927664 RepID=A0A1I1N2R2_9BACT|nr:ATP-binding cassette domain-containing protein [Flexibacter flexilis]SFC91636.1 ABC-type lipoprotein export system, ATPase component [Flexibacter flexilis DSM 6793]